MSSPSSQGSETVGTPPDHMYSSNNNGKRPSSSLSGDVRKKSRKDDEDDEVESPSVEKEEGGKAKPTRGSRYERLLFAVIELLTAPAEHVPKHELLTRSLRKMERTLDSVLRSIGNPDIASGYVSRSPSPSAQTATTQALLASPSPPPSAERSASFQHTQQQPAKFAQPGSPKLHSLPDNSLNPLGLLAEASLANRRAQAGSGHSIKAGEVPSTDGDFQKVGVASDLYFKPGPMTILPLRRLYIERQIQPEMLSFVSTEDVIALFDIYFDHMNMHCTLLDRDFHTPSLVCSRSPFLLTTICSIASKFYTGRPELHSRLTDLAKKLAFSVPAQGYKSVEIVQAYLLLTLYGCGAVERYEQDKTWLMLGMAIRMATDLNLHRKTAVASQDTPEGRARDKEVHNRERTWILTFCLDRSASAQMGKPHSVKEDLDFLYSGTNSPSGLQVDCDYLLVIKTIETQVLAWQHEWHNFRGLGGQTENAMAPYPALIGKFYFHYSMLVLNSFGLQNAMERSAVDIGHFFARCHSSATACALLTRDDLGPRGFLKYSPDSHFVMISYALLSLLKLVRPEFQAFLDNEHKTYNLVKDVADTMEGVAANPHHSPALYSSLIRALVNSRIKESAEASGNNGQALDPNANVSLNGHGNGTVDGDMSNMGTFMNPPPVPNGHSSQNNGPDLLNEFQFDSEMGPVADMSTFPPTMAAADDGTSSEMMSMDSILSGNFWDSVLVPGYSNALEGISGGFLYGAGGSGLITPRWGQTPLGSGQNSPVRGTATLPPSDLTQHKINAAFHE
ncbi:hypothetical protein HWV62_26410 [Athelia sp. TMB]|nr:hypothetical protein HWV62_26410 [Athelia sp. TMB]